jgi:hypothetical protein
VKPASGSGSGSGSNGPNLSPVGNLSGSGSGSGSGGGTLTTAHTPSLKMASLTAGSGSGSGGVNGEVWQDSNGDGLLDDGEPGIQGVTVNLDNSSGQTITSTTTDANGNYSFSVVVSQSTQFEVQVIIPSGDTATAENASGGTNSNIDGNGYSNVFTLNPGGYQTVNAGLVGSGSGSGSGSVSGVVWLDDDGDGLLDNGEFGLQAVTVNLDNASGQVLQTMNTVLGGNYSFNVATSPGSQFEIQVVIPSGYSATVEDASGGGTNSNIDTNGYSPVFALAPGGAAIQNAGLKPPQPIIVNTLNDDPNGPVAGQTTLRDAIDQANANPGSTITFQAGLNGTILLEAMLPNLTANVTIIGSNQTIQRAGNAGPFGIFEVFATVEIDNLTIKGGDDTTGGGIYNAGNLTLRNDTISNNTAAGKGGGIFDVSGSTLTLDHDIIEDNQAQDGGGIYNFSGSTLQSFAGNIASAIVNNTATADGGGIYNNGKVNLQAGDSIGLNQANMTSGNGGGVYNASGRTFLLQNGIIANNGAFQGGGVYNGGTATLPSDTIGGGNSANQGGGLYLTTGSTTDFGDGPNATTVSGNELVGAGAKGKGILYEQNATIFGNLTDDDDPGGKGVPK